MVSCDHLKHEKHVDIISFFPTVFKHFESQRISGFETSNDGLYLTFFWTVIQVMNVDRPIGFLALRTLPTHELLKQKRS